MTFLPSLFLPSLFLRSLFLPSLFLPSLFLPSLAFPVSPAETERGATYEFVLDHVVDSETPTSMFRTERRKATTHA